ncbi:hypothetical protein GCM10009841_28770 [Microlunatus panaciterrae]|uniref:Fenitrothion hydrolase n=1 Tax=Microlunatus panaciterrae TaxID=400768 RepID=A0ABS2RF03_9ACTN|nr:hypothetical protein [Microlunatus panaciterrae]MBM7797537.1 hypothetical protein [Microlunatus panaciterrae]
MTLLVPLHGIGSRQDLPLPFSYVVVGAAAALVISFVVLFYAWRRPRYPSVRMVSSAVLTSIVDHRVFRAVVRAVVLLIYAWAGLALFAGKDLLTNPAFGFVYAWMWVGLVPLSLLLGPFWRVTNPIRTLHAGLCALARVDPRVGLVSLPARVGVWPAVLGLFGFGWLELVQPERTTLPVLRLWALGWLLVLVVGAVLFGSRWIGAADPFESYAEAVAQLSPLRRVNGRIGLVNPLAGLNSWVPPPGAAALVSVLLGNTAYDSFTNTSWWIGTVQDSELSPILWGTLGLLGMIIIVFVTFELSTRWMTRYRSDPELGAADLPRLLAGSVVPIAIGYAVAHYATLLIIEGQRTAIHFSDPLGRGWNVFGSAEMGVNSTIFNHPTLIALIQLFAIVGGHLIGIVAAHEKSLALLRPSAALVGQVPLLLVMVFYTCSGLLLLFSP